MANLSAATKNLHGCLFETKPSVAPSLRTPMGATPGKVDLRQYMSPIEDQSTTSSCTANAIVGALEYHQIRTGQGGPDLSRMFVYYNARKMAGTENQDAGSLIHHVMASVLAFGACDERVWPFDLGRMLQAPPKDAYKDAEKREAVSYARMPLGQPVIDALAMGLPVVFGCYIPQEYYDAAHAKQGDMPPAQGAVPNPGSGHAMLIVGYDTVQKYWIVRNSWSAQWGDKGYCYIPWSTLEAYAPKDAFWVVGAIEGVQGAGLMGATMKDTLKETTKNAAAEAREAIVKSRAFRDAKGLQVPLKKTGALGEKKCWKCSAVYQDDTLTYCPACWGSLSGAAGAATAPGAALGGWTCPNGHTVPSDSTICPYCSAIRGGAQGGYVCGRCGSWVASGVCISCPGGAAADATKQGGYVCGRCGSWVASGVCISCPGGPVAEAAKQGGYVCGRCGSWVASGVCISCPGEAKPGAGKLGNYRFDCPKCKSAFNSMELSESTCPECGYSPCDCLNPYIAKTSPGAAARGYQGSPLPTSARRLDGCLFEKRPHASPVLRTPQGNLPNQVDLRQHMSPVEDQGQSNSCTANATVGALEFHQRKSGGAFTDISRLFVYYNARKMADKQGEDCGSFIHHAMASVLAYGACSESVWPFDLGQVVSLPSQEAYNNATQHEAVQYARCNLGDATLQALAAGLPVVFGTYMPSRFYDEAGQTGVAPSPLENPEPAASGHAMLIVGYDMPSRMYIVRNSWGAGWADKGYFKVPFKSLETYSYPDHFWAIGAIEAAQGMSLSGPTPQQAMQSTKAMAAAEVTEALAKLRGDLRTELQSELDKQKEDIRKRLRGETDKKG